MAGRLTRFLNLERPRKPSDEPAHEVMTPGRFTPEGNKAAAPAEHAHKVVTPGRFDPPELQLSPDHGEQPFLRCPSCEADNGRFAVKCINCGSRLDTGEVRAWNDQLWQARGAEAETARLAEEERQKQLEADRLALLASRRELGESIAQDAFDRERARGGASSPLGLRLLAQLDPNMQITAIVSTIAVFLTSATVAFAAHGHPLLQGLGGAIDVLLLSLFVPKRRRFF
jgi:hypothetical protein